MWSGITDTDETTRSGMDGADCYRYGDSEGVNYVRCRDPTAFVLPPLRQNLVYDESEECWDADGDDCHDQHSDLGVARTNITHILQATAATGEHVIICHNIG